MSAPDDFQIYAQPIETLPTCEHEEYDHIRDAKDEILPLFRVIGKDRAQQDNLNPEATFAYQKSRRRTPISAMPIVDLLLETHRMLCFPDLPSRQHSHFANLHGYQSGYLKKPNQGVYLVVPHKDAKVGITNTRDFKVSDPDAVFDAIQANIKSSQVPNNATLANLFEKKKRYDKPDYACAHQFLDLLSCVQSWIKAPQDAPQIIKEILSYFVETVSPSSFTKANVTGPEVMIEGKVHFIEILPKNFKSL
jgi:hypothetical protein